MGTVWDSVAGKLFLVLGASMMIFARPWAQMLFRRGSTGGWTLPQFVACMRVLAAGSLFAGVGFFFVNRFAR